MLVALNNSAGLINSDIANGAIEEIHIRVRFIETFRVLCITQIIERELCPVVRCYNDISQQSS